VIRSSWLAAPKDDRLSIESREKLLKLISELSELEHLREEVKHVHALIAALILRSGPITITERDQLVAADFLAGDRLGDLLITRRAEDGSIVLSLTRE
jgi:hypothetical protein